MSFERLVKKPRNAIKDSDAWVRRRVLSIISQEPNIDDRIFLEEMSESDDPIISFLAHKGLTKLFPLSNTMKNLWQDFFAETIDLLYIHKYRGLDDTMHCMKSATLGSTFSFQQLVFQIL